MWKCKCGQQNDENLDVCQSCGLPKPNKKHSTLGIVGFILSLIPCLGIVGFILCVIDAATKGYKKKVLPIIGIVISFIGFIFFIGIMASDTPSSSTSENKIEVSQEVDNDKSDTILVEETADVAEEIVEEVATPEPSVEIVEEPSPEPTPEPSIDPEIAMQEYIDSCEEYSYKEVMRNPSDYIGKRIKLEVQVTTVKKESVLQNQYYFAFDKENPDDTWYFNNKYGIWECRDENDPSYFKILEEDIIMVYGEIAEPQDTVSLITNSEELFCIDMKYAELLGE